ncbi:MAG: YitT family protein [Candidatus Pristimantibacillus lignocellulolyticus]|uniref:YitT family protein n=1 Tax=Candidatus Pristimantibacillus lignocellulolyticus TaxID=2994561 RepID=A0A9J6ZD74_9BACL|nr:MAG: YitT family protein [Candidatus Pristimantibacillus lignocellulolyticus]
MPYKINTSIKQLIPITIGAALYAFGLQVFVIPNQLMEGGVTGIAVLLNYIFSLPMSITTLIINIPLFLVGWKILGRKKMIYTIFGSVMLSIFLALLEYVSHRGYLIAFDQSYDSMLIVLYAGVTLGAGLGIVFRYGGTTGGIDIVARILSRWRGYSMGQIILVFDAIIIGVSVFYISLDKILYTLVMVFIASKMIDFIQNGAYTAKAFSIITDRGDEIAHHISIELERGVTLVPALGAYSGKDKKVVYCVVPRSETHRLKQLIRNIDPIAFIVIHEVQDVLGEGFKEEE